MGTHKLTLLVEKTRPDAVLPEKAHPDDSGFDLTLLGVAKPFENGVTLYSTGLKATIKEPGWDLRIVPRSSISKTDYMLANSIGIIDQSYRGEILVALRKLNPDAKALTFPIKFAQLIPHERPEVTVVECQLENTERGVGGFGSTGV